MSEVWYERWFGESYLDAYYHRDRSEARRFVETLLDRLELSEGARVLDVACGSGRHALQFALAGHRVTGVDLSLFLLQQGRHALRQCVEERETGEDPPDLLLVQGDMKELPVRREPGRADLVVNLFTAFGYFETEEEDAAALEEMALALKPGGLLVLDFLNRSRIVEDLVEEDGEYREGLHIKSERRLTDLDRRVEKTITLEYADGRVESHTESVRLYSRDDLERLARYTGLVPETFWGDYDGGEHTPSSPRCILVARRPL
ncbi:MAG: methyltransferase domain-containing protein [bacterium]